MADLINGLYELCGGVFVTLHIMALIRHKSVRGVSFTAQFFFITWGFWNLYFYPAVGAWLSFYGGLSICVANCVWLCLALHYMRKERHGKDHEAGFR